MRALTAVVFDFDGVLVDSVPVYQQAIADATGRAGIANKIAGTVAGSDTLTVAHRIIEQYHLDIDPHLLAGQIENFALDRLLKVPRVVPGAAELVRAICQAGLKTAIASLAPRRNIETILRREGMADCFDALVSVEDITNIKPHPEIFLKAAEALGLTGPDCIAIEDSPNGVTAALAAGMTAIAVTTTVSAVQLQHAHCIVGQLADMSLDRLRQIHAERSQTPGNQASPAPRTRN